MIIALLFLAMSSSEMNCDQQALVHEFHELSSRKEEAFFIERYTSSTDPSVRAYVLSLEMKKAEYAFNPIQKLRLFSKSRDELDRMIDSFPSNIHLRYIRLLVQENCPRILGYTENLEEDRSFLRKALSSDGFCTYMDRYIMEQTSL